ncbi:MAG TPA: hypothetical protein VHN15_14150 [Thermoanaerobaculia bacterium]|nr:hypothetical protein [Thermoanaerobaculia bacterium]
MTRFVSALLSLSLLLAGLSTSGCATAESRWEYAAVGAAMADVASTQSALETGGFREANPVYGSDVSAEKMLAINAGLYGGIWALTRNLDPVQQQKIWRTVTIIRLLAAGWNVSQQGCACFKVSF